MAWIYEGIQKLKLGDVTVDLTVAFGHYFYSRRFFLLTRLDGVLASLIYTHLYGFLLRVLLALSYARRQLGFVLFLMAGWIGKWVVALV